MICIKNGEDSKIVGKPSSPSVAGCGTWAGCLYMHVTCQREVSCPCTAAVWSLLMHGVWEGSMHSQDGCVCPVVCVCVGCGRVAEKLCPALTGEFSCP